MVGRDSTLGKGNSTQKLVAGGRGATFWNLVIVGMPVHGTRKEAVVGKAQEKGRCLPMCHAKQGTELS